MKAPTSTRGEVIAWSQLPHPDDHHLFIVAIENEKDFIVTYYTANDDDYFWGTYYPKAGKLGKDYWDLKAKALKDFTEKVVNNCKSFLNAEVV